MKAINHTFLFLLVIFFQCQTPAPIESGILIKGATIIDGTGSEPFKGDIRILNGRILEMGELKENSGDSVIDATGLILSPGFIDTHSHHDADPERTVEAAISQGITTIVIGQDGGSHILLGNFFDSLSTLPSSVNIASYVGHNTIREQVMEEDFKRTATEAEIAEMKKLVEWEMKDGALGLSTGLEYDPGIYSTTEEVIELAKVAAENGGRYISHMRSEDVGLEKSIYEIIRISKEAKIPVQISHFKLARKSLWGQADKILAILDSARTAGIEITADMYPYQYWQSTMTVLFPNRDFDNRASAEFALNELTSADGMIIDRFNAHSDYEGKTLAEIAKIRKEDPATTYMELIRLSQETPGESIIAKSMDEEDIKTLTRWPYTNLCSDGAHRGHPRGWGAFPKYLNMETGESIAMKIHKMTGQAAENIGLEDIGILKEGAYADLILFDPDNFKDQADYKNSTAKATGLRLVMVSGEIVYEKGEATSVYSGRVLKR